MDFLDFIKSNTIKKHLREVNYQPTLKDKICFVYHSKASLKEKHNAYKEIIETMPDCTINEKTETTAHDLLSKLMRLEDDLIEQFYIEDNSFYTIGFVGLDQLFKNEIAEKYYDLTHKAFKSIEECFIAVQENIPDEYFTNVCKIRIEKHPIDNDSIFYIAVRFDINNNILSIFPNYAKDSLIIDYDTTVLLFEALHLDKNFPTPFSVGDLITFDLLDNPYDILEENITVLDVRIIDNEHVYGHYYISDDGTIKFENLLLRVFFEIELLNPKELSEKVYIPKIISNYLKKKIDLSLFLKTYQRHLIFKELNNNKLSVPEIGSLIKLNIISDKNYTF